MSTINAELFGKAAGEIINQHIEAFQKDLDALRQVNDELRARNASYEAELKELRDLVMQKAQQGPQGIQGIQGERGERGDPGPAGERGEQGIQGIQGVQGERGEKGDRGDQGPQGERGETGLPGEKGEKGDPGERGEKGDRGDQGPQGERGETGIAGKDGKDGLNGKDGKDGIDGKDGKDGIGIQDAMIDHEGKLNLVFSDGRTKCLGVVVGKSFENFTMKYLPDSHEIAVSATVAGLTQHLRYPAGGIRSKGYWRDGMKAKAGDAYSLGGNLWVARNDTTVRPDYKSEDWHMMVQRGRDAMLPTERGIERAVSLDEAK